MIPSKDEINQVVAIATKFQEEQEKENRLLDKLGPTSTPVYVEGQGRVIIVAKSMDEKERIQDYLLDMLRALLWRDPTYLAKYKGVTVQDKQGKRYTLETDLATIIKIVDESCRILNGRS